MPELHHDPELDLEREDVRTAVDALLADRHSAEARALYLTLARYIDRRVGLIARSRYPDLLAAPDREELVGEVLYELMNGTLHTFRGTSLPELLAFVRCITDRTCWRSARRKLRERNALDGDAGDAVREWSVEPPGPDQGVRIVPESPFDEKDQEYLLSLLRAGSRSEHARREGVSRAAVTQRLQRIRKRIAAMSPREQGAAEAWLRNEARMVAEEL